MRIQNTGARVHSEAFTIIVLPNGGSRPRLGCAISRKVGNAVVRNRVRRLLKECFRHRAAELGPLDFVVIAKLPAAELARRGQRELDRHVEELLQRARGAASRPRRRDRHEGDPR